MVDDAGVPVADGEVGEIVVASNFLAKGYWQDDALTRRKFEQHGQRRRYRTGDFGRMHADGCLEYLGRAEAEPRIRGITLDRSALERALLRVPGVIDAAVTTAEGTSGDPILIAAVAVSAASGVSASMLREKLRADLPARAIPARFIVGDSLPLTAFGKIDRFAIAREVDTSIAVTEGEAGAARDELERQIAGYLESGSGIEFGPDYSVLPQSRRDSLQAMQILVRIDDALGVRLSPLQFLSLATIEDQAAFLRHALEEQAADDGPIPSRA